MLKSSNNKDRKGLRLFSADLNQGEQNPSVVIFSESDEARSVRVKRSDVQGKKKANKPPSDLFTALENDETDRYIGFLSEE